MQMTWSLAMALAWVLALTQLAAGQTFKILHSFNPGADGGSPFGGLLLENGQLYGAAPAGGSGGGGTIFAVGQSTGNLTPVYNFVAHTTDAAYPLYVAPVSDGAGNLYVTATQGGANNMGAVVKLDSSGHETILYSFGNIPHEGNTPYGGLLLDKGTLYGVTYNGGRNGMGTIYATVAATGATSTLYSFNGTDGGRAFCTLVTDGAGNLYGTTGFRDGSIFKLDTNAHPPVLTTLHFFTGFADGAKASMGVIRDAQGNLYGAATLGGKFNYGTVFRLDPSNRVTTLHNFTGGADGAEPECILLRDTAGNLYGTTAAGGSIPGKKGSGTVFKLDPAGRFTTLHEFGGPAQSTAGLVMDSIGNLYGTTSSGGSYGWGLVFEITK